MGMEKLLKRINLFHKLATSEKNIDKILEKLSSFDTFKDRVDYAENNIEHLSSGSSRVIYVLPDKTVLKLAKNDRGVAQNKVEGNPKMKSKFINETIKLDKNGYWKTSPFLEKITEKEFEKMVGISFKDFGEAISYGLKDVSEDKDAKKPENFGKIEKTDLYRDLVKLGKQFSLMPGDMARISSWGQVDDHPTLLDAGLTKDIYKKFYRSDE